MARVSPFSDDLQQARRMTMRLVLRLGKFLQLLFGLLIFSVDDGSFLSECLELRL